MRWTLDSWRAYAPDTSLGEPSDTIEVLEWGDASPSLIAARVDLACRAAQHLAEQVPPTVFVGLDGCVECWWTTPRDASPPFRAVSPSRWLLPADIDLVDLAAWARAAAPNLQLLTTVGVTPDHRLVLVDLDHWATLGVQAEEATARSVVTALVAGLGAPPLAPPPVLWWGGLQPPHDATTRVGGQVLADAETAVEALAAATRLPAVAVLDSWTTVHGASPHTGRAVVAVGRPPDGLLLVERDGLWTLEPHLVGISPVGTECLDLPADAGDTQAKEQYMTTSTHAALSVHRLAPGMPPPRRTPTPAERPWPLMVSVLGMPRVLDHRHGVVEFERSKALELVVWLAVHRPRCTRSGARSALWDLPIRDNSFANIVCDARRRLAAAATAPSGTEWIGRGLGDELPLHPHVVTDADLLRSATRAAHGNADPAMGDRLDDMLALVRGVPFEGTAYLWADAEGLTSELTMLIVQASAVSARRHLDAGDLNAVFDATAVGLRVVPRHEELVALRLRAHHRNGDDAGVRQEWSSYERALALDAFSSRPSSKLLALRQELLRRPVSA